MCPQGFKDSKVQLLLPVAHRPSGVSPNPAAPPSPSPSAAAAAQHPGNPRHQPRPEAPRDAAAAAAAAIRRVPRAVQLARRRGHAVL